MQDALWLLIGFTQLVVGADALTRALVALARQLRISQQLIASTLLAYATSLPELVVAITAAEEDLGAIAVGNVVGSNIAAVLLVLGTGAMVAPIHSTIRAIGRETAFALVGQVMFLGAALRGQPLDRWGGALFLAALAGITAMMITLGRNAPRHEAASNAAAADNGPDGERPAGTVSSPVAVLLLTGGLALLVSGGHMVVQSAAALARALGVDATVIGLTLVGTCSASPELVTVVVAALRGHPEIVLGGVLGSNIFNVLGCLGVAALVAPLPLPREIALLEMWLMLGATLLPALLLWRRGRINRLAGGLLLAGYVAYLLAVAHRA